ncbi:MAG: 30S ribosomal protein S18 [Candidatus Peribacteria bacterium]|nr:MAG: 30S ribosomal protein S18 [Candidatus Peribacteria bacterium]
MFRLPKKSFFSHPEREELINWKSVALLKTYTTRFGNIKPRKFSTNTVRQQKEVRKAIIRARELGLLPYVK